MEYENQASHVYHHTVSETKVNMKLEKNSKGFNYEVTVTGASTADEALEIIRDAEQKLYAAYGQPATGA